MFQKLLGPPTAVLKLVTLGSKERETKLLALLRKPAEGDYRARHKGIYEMFLTHGEASDFCFHVRMHPRFMEDALEDGVVQLSGTHGMARSCKQTGALLLELSSMTIAASI